MGRTVSAILKQELLQLRRSDETRTDAKGSQFGDRLFEFGPQARFLADSNIGDQLHPITHHSTISHSIHAYAQCPVWAPGDDILAFTVISRSV